MIDSEHQLKRVIGKGGQGVVYLAQN